MTSTEIISLPERLSKSEQKERTRHAILSTAREEFASKGYAQAATNVIVERTGLTRGALYHHFRDKQALFEAVFEAEQLRLLTSLNGSLEGAESPRDAVMTGLKVLLRSLSDSAQHRILLTDAPVVLGWARWRELDHKYLLGALERLLGEADEAGSFAFPDLAVAAKMISAALSEAAMIVAEAEDPDETMAAAIATLKTALAGFAIEGEAADGKRKDKAKRAKKDKGGKEKNKKKHGKGKKNGEIAD